MKSRTLAVGFAAASLAVALGWSLSRPDPIRVAVVAIERGSVVASVSNTRAGTVDACQRARMAPVTGGQIAALPVAEGDQVDMGAVLMELWNADVRAQLAVAENNRLVAAAREQEACATARVATREAKRLGRLHQQGMGSEERADLAEGEAQARRAACEAAQGQVEVSKAAIEAATAAIERTILRAPFAGTVAEINGEIGEVVTPSPVGVPTPPAVDLVDNTCLYVTAPIDEIDAPQIRAGMRASITLDAFPDQRFSATVRRVAPYVLDLEKQARTVDIEAEFDEPCDNLLPGYSADVEVILDHREDALRIPTQALVDGARVLLLDAGTLVEQKVEVGLRNWRFTEVVSGLTAGDQVVLSVDRPGVEAGAAAVVDE